MLAHPSTSGAEGQKQRYHRNRAAGTGTEPGSASLVCLTAAFLADLQQANYSPPTLRAYAADLAQFAAFAPADATKISADMLRAFWLAVATHTPATRARKQACLARFLTWAYRHDLLPANPMDRVDRVKREPPLPRGVGQETVEAILAVIPAHHLRDRLLFRLIVETGMRIGEALGV